MHFSGSCLFTCAIALSLHSSQVRVSCWKIKWKNSNFNNDDEPNNPILIFRCEQWLEVRKELWCSDSACKNNLPSPHLGVAGPEQSWSQKVAARFEKWTRRKAVQCGMQQPHKYPYFLFCIFRLVLNKVFVITLPNVSAVAGTPLNTDRIITFAVYIGGGTKKWSKIKASHHKVWNKQIRLRTHWSMDKIVQWPLDIRGGLGRPTLLRTIRPTTSICTKCVA